MEQARFRFASKLGEYQVALVGLEKLLAVDLNSFDPDVADGLRNGQIQKFEIVTELAWKLIKIFLFIQEGVDCKSPKSSFRELFNNDYIEDHAFEKWVEIIDCRNEMSHVYNETVFEKTLQKLPSFIESFRKIIKITESIGLNS